MENIRPISLIHIGGNTDLMTPSGFVLICLEDNNVYGWVMRFPFL